MWLQSCLRPSKLLSSAAFKSKALSARAAFFVPGSAALLSEPYPKLSSDEDEEQQYQQPLPYQLQQQRPELDSVKVSCIIRSFKRDPDAALCFFQQLTEFGFSHDVSTYAALVTVLSGSPGLRLKLQSLLSRLISSESRDFDVFDLLEYLSREGRIELAVRVFDAVVKVYVTKGMFEEAIDSLFKTNRRGFMPHVFTCNFLMNRLIERGKPHEVVSLYKQLKNRVRPNDYMYAIVIKALCKQGNLEEAEEVFGAMEEAGVIPTTYAYTTYIEGLCWNSQSEVAYQVLELWQRAKIPFNVYAYAAVIQGFCSEMKLERAKGVLVKMEGQGMVPDTQCYGPLIRGHCKSLNLRQALDLHEEMISKGIKTNCVIIGYILQSYIDKGMFTGALEKFNEFKQLGVFIDEVTYNIILDALCKLEKVDEAMELHENMRAKQMALDSVHYTTLINGFCLKGNMKCAIELFKEMKKIGSEPDIITYNVLAGGFSRAGQKSKVLNLLAYMERQGIKPDTVTHNMIIEGLCIAGKVKQAEAFLESIDGKSMENDCAMLSGYCKANYTIEAFDLFVSLSKKGVLVKKSYCFKLLQNLCTGHFEDRALIVLKRMLVSKIEPTSAMYNNLIAGLCQNGDMRNARWLFVESGLAPDVISFTCMIRGYLRNNHLQEAYNLFICMKNIGIEPDLRTYTVLLDGYSKAELTRESSSISKGKREVMNAEISDIVSDILVEMNDRNVAPDVICYTVVINRFCKLGKLDEAWRLFHEMIDRGLQPDLVTYTSLIVGLCRLGIVDMAMQIAQEMTSNGVILDAQLLGVLKRSGHKQII